MRTHGHLGSGLKKQVVIFAEGPGDSHVDSAAASQDGFIYHRKCRISDFDVFTLKRKELWIGIKHIN